MPEKLNEGWKPGPLPPETWNWGGVVKKGDDPQGFYFADFHGDYVVLLHNNERLEADQVAFYNNGIKLPLAKFGTTYVVPNETIMNMRLGQMQ